MTMKYGHFYKPKCPIYCKIKYSKHSLLIYICTSNSLLKLPAIDFCSLPISLQFGLVGLKKYVPANMNQLEAHIAECEQNTQIRTKIQNWFKENGELKYVT